MSDLLDTALEEQCANDVVQNRNKAGNIRSFIFPLGVWNGVKPLTKKKE